MRVFCLQHVAFEGPGAIEGWLARHDHSLSRVRLFAGELLPAVGDFDWLIVMGGPMGANDDDRYPWLHGEKELIRAAIEEGKIVLGICLGAQLIASALGARVFANPHREIGWFPVTRTADAAAQRLGRVFPERCEVFHWHGDTFDLPAGGVRLASSEACLNQAFCVGERVLGLQFHVETTAGSAAELVTRCGDELAQGGDYVQTPEQMLVAPERFDRANTLMADVLSALAGAAT